MGSLSMSMPLSLSLSVCLSVCLSVRWSGGQVVRWSGGQVVRWPVGQFVRWSGDLGSFVSDVQTQLKAYTLPSGYWIEYGGQFENLASAKARMQIVIPLTLITIFILLMAVFHNVKE